MNRERLDQLRSQDRATASVWVCEGKVRFSSQALARKAASRKKGRDIFQCGCCGSWHVGTKFWKR